MRNYFEVYASRDEMPPRLLRRPLGALNHIPDLYSERERRTSLAYNEHLLRSESQNGLVVRLEELDSLRVAWSLGDPVGSDGWQPDHVRLIESLAPHVRQLVRVRQALADADALSAGLAGLLDTSGIGVLHLDRGGRVLAANAPALDILRGNKGLSDRRGTLHAQLQADDGRLQRLLRRALPVLGNQTPPTGGSITIQRPLLPSRLELHVHPMNTAPVDWGAPSGGAGAGGRPGAPSAHRPGPAVVAARSDAVGESSVGPAGRRPAGARDRRDDGLQGKLRPLASV